MTESSEILPTKIEHLVDAEIDPRTGLFLYHYNYLVYTFAHPLGLVTARSYLDTPREVSILKAPSVEDFGRELDGIIRYLRARYSKLNKLGGEGYVEF